MANGQIQNSVTKSNWIAQGLVAAAGTTLFKTAGYGAATNLDALNGYVIAGVGVQSLGWIRASTYIRGDTGLYFAKGNAKNFSAGTYIGIGGATCPLQVTGLTTIHQIIMTRNRTNYNTATTTGNVIPQGAIAAGTPGSFYPTVYRVNALGAIALGAAAGATFRWTAIGV